MNFEQVYTYTKELSVLYVENDLKVLESTSKVLNKYFLNVTTAMSSEIALSQYKNFKLQSGEYYDLLITALKLPQENGLVLIKKIRSINYDQVIVVTSLSNDSSQLIELIQNGISNFLMKPFDQNQLIHLFYNTSKTIYNHKEKFRLELEKRLDTEKQEAVYDKMLWMSEMLDNIAHQYRQPLSVISSVASGMIMEKEFETFDENTLNSNCETIIQNTQYLSNIIDEFSELNSGDNQKSKFNVSSVFNKILNIEKNLLSSNNIQIRKNFNESIQLLSYKTLLIHAIMSILNNAKDILSEQKSEKVIFIDIFQKSTDLVIRIKDNGGGVDDDIINKIFDIYFTTKHKSVGTGVGLYTVYNIVKHYLKGKIEVQNETFEYKNRVYKGAVFDIILPINVYNKIE